jgi:hypothetical protein
MAGLLNQQYQESMPVQPVPQLPPSLMARFLNEFNKGAAYLPDAAANAISGGGYLFPKDPIETGMRAIGSVKDYPEPQGYGERLTDSFGNAFGGMTTPMPFAGAINQGIKDGMKYGHKVWNKMFPQEVPAWKDQFTRGPFYHGSKQPIEKLDPMGMEHNNNYGPGFYTTEDLYYAKNFSRNRMMGEDGNVYQINFDKPHKLYDLDGDITDDFLDTVRQETRKLQEEYIENETRKLLEYKASRDPDIAAYATDDRFEDVKNSYHANRTNHLDEIINIYKSENRSLTPKELYNSLGNEEKARVNHALLARGYDGMTVEAYQGPKGSNHTIFFHPDSGITLKDIKGGK